MAQTDARMDEYMLYSPVAETAGVYHEFLTPKQIKDRWPLVRTEDLKGALFHPQDGYINPADVTQAMAKGARHGRRTIERRSRSTATAGPAANGSSPAQDGGKGRQPGRLGRKASKSTPNMS
jgi:glycine/D-amino acid oxidase-like deaminating enzyme